MVMTNRLFAFITTRRFQLLLLMLMLLSLTGFAQTQYAKPRKGEGITTFLQRHGRIGQEYYKEFLELNKQKLKGPTAI